jgi:HlyD family secretion protein
MKSNKIYRVWLACVLVIAAGLLSGCGGTTGPTSMQWETEAVETGDLTTSVIASGSVRPNRAAALAWQTSGKINGVWVELGAQVDEKVILADLDPDSMPQTYYMAQIDLQQSRQAQEDLLQNSGAQTAAAYQELVDAQKALDDANQQRSWLTADRRAVNPNAVDAARAEYLRLEELVERAEDDFNSMGGADDAVRYQAEANLANLRMQRDNARFQYEYLIGEPSEQELSEADAAVAAAQARFDEAQRSYDRLKNGVPEEDLYLAQARVKAAEAALRQIALEAPFAGTVTEVQAHAGDVVSAGTPAFRMEDRSRFFVDVAISEMDVHRIHSGSPVTITFDSVYGKEYTGQVLSVSLSGDNQQGVVTYPVVVELNGADEDIRSGMTAVVKISVETVKDALLVPNRAVRMVDNERVVYVQKPGAPLPEKVTVLLGISSETMSQVLESELQPGDLIVLNPDMLVQAETMVQ